MATPNRYRSSKHGVNPMKAAPGGLAQPATAAARELVLPRDSAPAAGPEGGLPGSRTRAPLRPGVLLDRDGTIIVDHGYVGSVDRVDFIDGAPEAIAALNRARVPVAVVTNQSGVARGLYGIDDVTRVHDHMAEQLALAGAHIDLFVFCPYHPDGTVGAFARMSEDRKPGPGMARAAAAALSLDLHASWVVGDRPEDVGLATAVGASAIYLGPPGTGGPRIWSQPTLAAAAPFILEHLAV
jgi:histidinol-phosphate phosphatase family protein